MFSKLFSLVVLAVAANAQDTYWIFGGSRPIITTRLDSIVSPGGIGTHVHAIAGASKFKNVYDMDDLLTSNCTTVQVQADKSNYWAPLMYYHDQTSGVFTPMTAGFNIYYEVRPGPAGEPIKAFPPGLRMIAGNTNRRTFNASSFADQAISFVCLDYSGAHSGDPDWAERNNFFDHNCPDGLRAQVYFPACWDGVNLTSADQSHMAYPVQSYTSGDCPDTHPVHLISIFYEMFVDVQNFDYWGAGAWVLANGDPTGYGFHGDFQNGWDVTVLQDAIDNCPNNAGSVQACAPLAASLDQNAADACVLETDYVDENIGFNASDPITTLTGCNPVWDGTTGARPTCGTLPTPSLIPAQTPLPTGWTEYGCIAEGTSGRALAGASTTNPEMTRELCINFCAGKGFSLAGVEYSDECYCDNAITNGATSTLLSWEKCNMHCDGNSNEICGGPSVLTVFASSANSLKRRGGSTAARLARNVHVDTL